MRHLRRAAALLLAVLVIVFVVPRLVPTTSFLENYGFYPKKNDESAQLWASRPMQYAEPVRCNACHNDKHDTWVQSAHRSVSCENCHGPGEVHLEKGTPLAVDTAREACGVCHARVVARPRHFPQVDLEQHGGQAACVTCHNPHNPRVATTPVIPHTLEGRTDCLLCHNTGGIKPAPKDHEGRTSGSCLSCHRSK